MNVTNITIVLAYFSAHSFLLCNLIMKGHFFVRLFHLNFKSQKQETLQHVQNMDLNKLQ